MFLLLHCSTPLKIVEKVKYLGDIITSDALGIERERWQFGIYLAAGLLDAHMTFK